MLETIRNWSAVSVPSHLAPAFTRIFIGCRVVAPEELFLPGIFEPHGPAGFDRCKGTDILGQHFLLRAEAAADTLRKKRAHCPDRG